MKNTPVSPILALQSPAPAPTGGLPHGAGLPHRAAPTTPPPAAATTAPAATAASSATAPAPRHRRGLLAKSALFAAAALGTASLFESAADYTAADYTAGTSLLNVATPQAAAAVEVSSRVGDSPGGSWNSAFDTADIININSSGQFYIRGSTRTLAAKFVIKGQYGENNGFLRMGDTYGSSSGNSIMTINGGLEIAYSQPTGQQITFQNGTNAGGQSIVRVNGPITCTNSGFTNFIMYVELGASIDNFTKQFIANGTNTIATNFTISGTDDLEFIIGEGDTYGSFDNVEGKSLALGSNANTKLIINRNAAHDTWNPTDGGNITLGWNISGSGGVVQRGTGTTTLTGTNTYTGNTTVTAGTLKIGGASALTTGGTVTITSPGSIEFAATQTVSRAITGTGILAVSGNNTITTLAGSNTFSGGILIGAGATLNVSAANSTAGLNALSSASIGSGEHATRHMTFENGGTLKYTAADASLSIGHANHNYVPYQYGPTTAGEYGVLDIEGGLALNGLFGNFIKRGTGMVYVGGGSGYKDGVGNLIIEAGSYVASSSFGGASLTIYSGAAFYGKNTSNAFNGTGVDVGIRDGGFLDLRGVAATIDVLSDGGGTSGGTISNSGNNATAATGAAIVTSYGTDADAVLTVASGSFSGSIKDGSKKISLVKTGNGTLSLTGTGNNFTGNITVTGGILDTGTLTAAFLGANNGRTIILANNATIRVATDAANYNFYPVVSGNGIFDVPLNAANRALEFRGGTTGGSTVAEYSNFTKAGAGIVYTGSSGHFVNTNLTVAAGRLILSGQFQTNNGTITIRNGAVLSLTNDNNRITGTGVTLAFDSGGTLDLHGIATTIQTLTGNIGFITNTGGFGSVGQFYDANASGQKTGGYSRNANFTVAAGNFGGQILDYSATNPLDTLTLIKTTDGSLDGGTLSLGGINSYTGATTINAGTLAITNNGELGATAVSLASNTTFSNAGNSAGITSLTAAGENATIQNTGTLGNSATPLTFGNYATLTNSALITAASLSLGSNSTVNNSGTINLTGTVVIGENSTVTNTGSINSDSSITIGSNSTVTNTGTDAVIAGNIVLDGTGATFTNNATLAPGSAVSVQNGTFTNNGDFSGNITVESDAVFKTTTNSAPISSAVPVITVKTAGKFISGGGAIGAVIFKNEAILKILDLTEPVSTTALTLPANGTLTIDLSAVVGGSGQFETAASVGTYTLLSFPENNASSAALPADVTYDYSPKPDIPGLRTKSNVHLTSTALVLEVDVMNLNLVWRGDGNGGETNVWVNKATHSSSNANNFVQVADTSTYETFYNGDTLTFDDTAASTAREVKIIGEVGPASILVNTSDGYGYSFTADSLGSGSITDFTATASGITSSVALIKTGTGKLIIQKNVTNSFTGGVHIAEGTLVIGADNALGAAYDALSAPDAFLTLGNDEVLDPSAPATSATLQNLSGAGASPFTIAHPITIAGTGATFDINTAGTTPTSDASLTISAPLTISAGADPAVSLKKIGTGTLALTNTSNAANLATTPLRIEAGAIQSATADALPAGTLTLAAAVNAAAASLQIVTPAPTTTPDNSAALTVTLPHSLVLDAAGGTLEVRANSASADAAAKATLYLSNPAGISENQLQTAGTASLRKTGAGTLVLQGVNSFTGAFEIAGGRVLLDSAGTELGDTLNTPASLAASTITILTGASLKNAGSISGEVIVKSGAIFESAETTDTATVTTAKLNIENGGVFLTNGGVIGELIAADGATIKLSEATGTVISTIVTDDGAAPAHTGTLTLPSTDSDGGLIIDVTDVAKFLTSATFPVLIYDKLDNNLNADNYTIIGLPANVPGRITINHQNIYDNLTGAGQIEITAEIKSAKIYWNPDAAATDPAGTILEGKHTWNIFDSDWQPFSDNPREQFHDNDEVIFTDQFYNEAQDTLSNTEFGTNPTDARRTVTLVGKLRPKTVTVNSDYDFTFESVGTVTVGSATYEDGSINDMESHIAAPNNPNFPATTLTKDGAGTLTIKTKNTYSGGTTVLGGTLAINNAAALGTGSLNLDGGTTLRLLADGSTGSDANITALPTSVAITVNSTVLTVTASPAAGDIATFDIQGAGLRVPAKFTANSFLITAGELNLTNAANQITGDIFIANGGSLHTNTTETLSGNLATIRIDGSVAPAGLRVTNSIVNNSRKDVVASARLKLTGDTFIDVPVAGDVLILNGAITGGGYTSEPTAYVYPIDVNEPPPQRSYFFAYNTGSVQADLGEFIKSGTLEKRGSGILKLSADNSKQIENGTELLNAFTGDFVIQDGVISFSSLNNLGTFNAEWKEFLTAGSDGNGSQGTVINGIPPGTPDVAPTWNSYEGVTIQRTLTFDNAGTTSRNPIFRYEGTTDVTLPEQLSVILNSAGTFDVVNSTSRLEVAVTVTGTGSFTKTGTGTLILTQGTDNGGGVTITAGTLETPAVLAGVNPVGYANTIPLGAAGSGLHIGPNATLRLRINDGVPAILSAGDVHITGNPSIIETAFEPTNPDSSHQEPTYAVITGILYGTNSTILQKTGGGTLILTADSTGTFTGGIKITAGNLLLSTPEAAGDSDYIETSLNGHLRLAFANGRSDTGGSDDSPATFSFKITGNGFIELAQAVDTAGKSTGAGTAVSFNNVNGTLFSGTYSVGYMSTLVVNASNDLGAGSWKLQLDDTTAVLRVAPLALGSSDTSVTFPQTASVSAYSGATIDVAGDRELTIRGTLSTTSGIITKIGAGTLTLAANGNNAQTGTLLSEGTLSITKDEHLGVANAPLVFDGGTLYIQSAILSLADTRDLILRGNAANNTAGIAAATINTDIAKSRLTLNSPLTDAPTGLAPDYIYAKTSLVKEGLGTLAIAVPQTYAGATIINAGKLELNAADALATSHILTVNGTARINASAAQTLAALNLTSSATLDFSAGATPADRSLTIAPLDPTLAGNKPFIASEPTDGVADGTARIAGTLSGLATLNIAAGATLEVAAGKSITVADKITFAHSEPNVPAATLEVKGTTPAIFAANEIEFSTPDSAAGETAAVIKVASVFEDAVVVARANSFTGVWTAVDVNGREAPAAPSVLSYQAAGINAVPAAANAGYAYELRLENGLVWNNASTYTFTTGDRAGETTGTAHGFFHVAAATASLSLTALLADNTNITSGTHPEYAFDDPAQSIAPWDGKSLTKTGAGELVLSNVNNSFTGKVTVTEGTLTIKSLGALNAAGTLAPELQDERQVYLESSDSTLNFDLATQTAAGTFSKKISGPGSIEKHGASTTLTLGSATGTDFSGETRISAGRIALTADVLKNSAAVIIRSFDSNDDTASRALTLAGVPATIGTVHIKALSGDAKAVVELGATHLVIGLAGTLAGTEGDGSGDFSGKFTGGGSITKTGTGRLTLSGENANTGGVRLEEGELFIGANKALGSALQSTLTHAADADADLDADGVPDGTNALVIANGVAIPNAIYLDAAIGASSGTNARAFTVESSASSATISSKIAGDYGATFRKSGEGTLTLSNPEAFGSALNAPSFGNGSIEIAAGTLEIKAEFLAQKLSGNGTLLATIGSPTTKFTFGEDAANGFAGTFSLPTGTLELGATGDGANNYAAIKDAHLLLDQNASINVTGNVGSAALATGTTPANRLRALTTNGGTIAFTLSPITATGILYVKTLDLSKPAKIRLATDAAAETTEADPAGTSWFDLYSGNSKNSQQLISATEVLGADNLQNLTILDADNNNISSSGYERKINDDGDEVGSAKFIGTASVFPTGAQQGVRLITLLREISAHASKTVTLEIPAGADAARLDAKLTGSGNFLFVGNSPEDVATFGAQNSNTGSDYTGATTIRSVTLRANTPNALGITAALTLEDNGSFDLNGQSQQVGALHGTSANSKITLGTGIFTVAGTGEFAGSITGTGTFTKSAPGILTLSGNFDPGTQTNITNGELRLTGTLGSVPADSAVGALPELTSNLQIAGTLVIANSIATGTQTITGATTGIGALIKEGTGELVLAPSNNRQNLHNTTTVSAGSLRISGDAALGTGKNALLNATLILDAHDDPTFAKNWTIAGNAIFNTAQNAVLTGKLDGAGTLIKTGEATLTLDAKNEHTGGITISAGTLAVYDTPDTLGIDDDGNEIVLVYGTKGDDKLGAGTNTLNGETATLDIAGGTFNKSWTVGPLGGTVINSENAVFNGDFAGTGTLHKNGIASITDPAEQPVLQFNGVVSAKLLIGTGGAVGGTGTLSQVSFKAGAIIAPGLVGEIGTLQLGLNDHTTVFDSTYLRIDIAASGGTDWLKVAGNVEFLNNTIDLSVPNSEANKWPTTSFAILTAAGNLNTTDKILASTTFLWKGIDITSARLRATATVGGEGNKSIIIQTFANTSQADPIWNPDSATDFYWNKGPSADANWEIGDGQKLIFMDGDRVTFPTATINPNASRNIQVTDLGGGVVVGAMLVEGDNYLFAGGKIVGTDFRSTGPEANDPARPFDGWLRAGNENGTHASATFENEVDFAGIEAKNNSTLTFNGDVRSATAIEIAEGGTVVLAGRSRLDSPSVNNNGSFIVERSAGRDFLFAGEIRGGGSVTKRGAGTLELTAANSYTGGTLIEEGTLILASDANIGSGTNTLDGATATVRLTGTTYNATWNIGDAGGTFEVPEGKNVIFGGKLKDADDVSVGAKVTKSGAGKLTLTAGAEFTGPLTIAEGKLEINGVLGGDGSSSITLHNGNIVVGPASSTDADATELIFNRADGIQTLSGELSGAGTLRKQGASQLVLSRNGSHSLAQWSNDGGSLIVVGDIAASRGVSNAGTFGVNALNAGGDGLANSGDFSVTSTLTAAKATNSGTLKVGKSATFTAGTFENSGSFDAAALDAPHGFKNSGSAILTGEAVVGLEGAVGDDAYGKLENAAGASLTAASLTLRNGGTSAGTIVTQNFTATLGFTNAVGGLLSDADNAPAAKVTVDGATVNQGTIYAVEAVFTGEGLSNSGVINVSSRLQGKISNTGAGASVTAPIVDGTLENNGFGSSTTVADVGRVTQRAVNTGLLRLGGDVADAARDSDGYIINKEDRVVGADLVNNVGGTIDLKRENLSHSVAGTFTNDGLVNFCNFGQVLSIAGATDEQGRVVGLRNASENATGRYSIEIDFETPLTSDHIVLEKSARIEGNHMFIVRTVAGTAFGNRESIIPLIIGGILDDNAKVSLAAPVEAGIYRFDIAPAGTAAIASESRYTVALSYAGLAALGQAAINSAGVLGTAWFAQLDNLSQRLGDLRVVPPDKPRRLKHGEEPPPPPPPPGDNDFWVRAYGSQLETNFGIRDIADARVNQYGGDIGYDHVWHNVADGDFVLGLSAGYQTTRLTFHDVNAAKGTTESVGGSVYALWHNVNGWFIGAVARGANFDTDFKSNGSKIGYDSNSAGTSIEAGRRFTLGSFAFNGAFFVEPSVQVSYSHLFAGSYTINENTTVHTADSDILQYSANIRVGHTWTFEDQGSFSVWLRAGAERQDTATGGEVSFSDNSTRYSPTLDGTRAVGGVGLNWSITKNHQVHASYEAVGGEKYRKPWSVSIGYRVRF